MREGWSRTTIGAAADVVGGGTPRTSEPSYWGGPIPWITPTEVVAAEGAAITTTTRTLTELGLQKSGARLLPEASILVTSRATVGAVAMAGCQMATNQGFAALIAGPLLVPKFLMLWSQANAGEFRMRAGGSTFPEISRSVVREIPIDIPPLDEQRRIVDIIGSLDATIAAADQAIAKATRARQALLLELIAGRRGSKSGPEGRERWSSAQLREVAALAIVREEVDASLDYLFAGVLNEGRGVFLRERVSGSSTSYRYLHVLEADALVMRKLTAWEGPVAVVGPACAGAVVSPEFPTFRLNTDRIDPLYMGLVCQQPWFWTELRLRATGTVSRRRRVHPDGLLDITVPLPPLDEQRRIVGVISTLDEDITAMQTTAAAARIARSGMLTELLSGTHEIPPHYDRLLDAA